MGLSYTCAACGHQMVVPERYAGRELACTACQRPFTAPVAGDEPETPPVLERSAPVPAVAPPASTCTLCGAGLPAGAAFCPRCGGPVGAANRSLLLRRPVAVTILAVVNALGACVLGFGALIALIGGAKDDPVLAAVVGAVCGLVAILQVACAIGLWRLAPWGRVIQIVLACVGLLLIPVGTLVAALILWYLILARTRILFSGKQAAELTAAELALLARRANGATVLVVAAAAVAVVLVAVAVVGIIAAIAIPSLLNAANHGKQRQTMSDLRAIGSGLEAYWVDHKSYPAGARSVEDLVPHLQPTYIQAVPGTDGWKRPFQLEVSKAGDGYRIASYGGDGKPDPAPAGGATTDYDADIVYENGQFVQWPEGKTQ